MGSNVLTKERVFVQNEGATSSSTVTRKSSFDNSTVVDQNKYDLANKISQDILESPFKEDPTFNPSNFSSVNAGPDDSTFSDDTPLSDMGFSNTSSFSEGLSKNKKIIIYSSVSILVLILSLVILKSLGSSSNDSSSAINNDTQQTDSLITEDTTVSSTETDSSSTTMDKDETSSNETISLLPDGVKKYIPDSMNQKLEELLSVLSNLKPGTNIKKHKKTIKKTIVTAPTQQEDFTPDQSGLNVATNSTTPNIANKSISSTNNSNNSSSSNSNVANSNNTSTTTNNTYNTYSGASNSMNPDGSSLDNGSSTYTDPNTYSDTNSDSDSSSNPQIANENSYQEEIPQQKPRVYGTERANSTPYTKDLPTSSKGTGTIPDNPYWNLPNRVFKDVSQLSTMDVNDFHKYSSNMNNSFNYQRYKTILEVKALQQKGSEKILIAGSKEPKLWSRMNALMGLADLGYELDISEIESSLNNERSTLISGFFRRYASREVVTEGELYILRQSIKVTDQDARFNILKTLSRWDNNLADLYFVAASYDPSNKIKKYANRFLKSRNLDEETMELYRNIIIGNTEVDFMIGDEEEGNISQNTSSNDVSSVNG